MKMIFKSEALKINTKQQTIDINGIQNRRFMYNPTTGTLLLGRHCPDDSMPHHAEDHRRLKAEEPFESFIHGWIGYGGLYAHGVIHFTIPIEKENMERCSKALSTLEMFAHNGAEPDTVVRGYLGEWEQPLSNIIKTPTLLERLEQKKQEVKRRSPSDKTPSKARKAGNERG